MHKSMQGRSEQTSGLKVKKKIQKRTARLPFTLIAFLGTHSTSMLPLLATVFQLSCSDFFLGYHATSLGINNHQMSIVTEHQ